MPERLQTPWPIPMRLMVRKDVRLPMEHRTELEQILLAGLPERERHETLESIRAATAKKLKHLRQQDRAEESGSLDYA
jgi:hypothetical protein